MDIVDPDRPYPMHRPRLGHAVIVNNVSSEMPGSKADVTALKVAYEAVGFDVQIHTDCNGQQMRSVKKFIMAEDSHIDCNCFALTIICHGNDKGQLLDRDRKKAWDTELFIGELSDVETLAGKPKIMVIQSCRGTQMSTGREVHYLAEVDERETTNILPDKADMFLAYATVPGFRAHGGDENGSVYLQALATYLQQEYMDRPLNKILQMVRQYMVRKDQDCKGMRQCPEERNSLIYDVMFSEYHKRNPGRPPVVAHPHQPSSGYSDKGSDIGYPGKDSRYSDKGSVAGYSSKGPAAGYTSGYSDKGQVTGYHSGYSGKQSSAGYHSGYSDKGLVAGYPRKGAQDPVQHSRGGVQPGADHTRGYSGNGVPSSAEDKVSQQMGRLKTTDTFGAGGPVTLSLTFTHKTDLKEASSFTVLAGDVVVCGRAGRGPWEYYTYSKQYNESHAPKHVIKVYLKSDRRVSCKHEVHMLPYGPENNVLTSCEWCKKLQRVNLGAPDKTAMAVYSGEDLWPGRLCEGDSVRTLVYSLGKILEFGVHFSTGAMKTIDTGLSNCIGMCYVDTLKVAVLSDGSGGVIRAVVCEDGPGRRDPRAGDVLWEVKGIVDGVKCDPHGVIYLPAPRDILLVCDGSNTRLLVLEPSTGNHRQSIGLPETMGEVQDLCYHNNDELVVLHNADNLFNISFFSMMK